MANPTLYKKKPITTVRNKSRENLSVAEQTSVDAAVDKFFELFKIKHLS